jgi:hypothetical protein
MQQAIVHLALGLISGCSIEKLFDSVHSMIDSTSRTESDALFS